MRMIKNWTNVNKCGSLCVALLISMLPASPTMVKAADRPAESASLDKDIASLERISTAFGTIAQQAKPSVVSIKAMAVNDEINDELRRMLKDEDFPGVPISGTGSGVIIDSDGHIVTNNHVISDAQVVQVTLADGRDFRASIIGADPKTDLAVIRIKADRLQPARFGDSDSVQVGNLVLAIGSPFKFGHSVSHGIISAIGRSDVDVDVDYKNWLQTDAPINPGNSGGPLINMRGEIVGINVAIATESGGYMGVGFAIPSNTVKRITSVLKRGEKIVRGYLGVAIRQVDLSMASAYGLGEPIGAFIDAVGPDTPAETGGLEPEDIVLKIDGKEVRSQEQLQEWIAATSPGTETSLTVWRRNKNRELQIKVGAQPSDFSTTGSIRDLTKSEKFLDDENASDESKEVDHSEKKVVEFSDVGLEVAALTPELAKKHKLSSKSVSGVVITRVEPLGEAYGARMHRGDLIVRANDEPVRTVSDLKRIMTPEALVTGLRLRVRRGNDSFHTVLRAQK